MNLRPYCLKFLKFIKKYFEVYIFSSSTENYCKAVINFIDPKGELIDGLLSQKNCLRTKNGIYIKDLRIITNRKLESMILIDHSVHSFGSLIENGIPLLSWTEDPEDKELKYLVKYLKKLSEVDDVRKLNQESLKLNEIIETKTLRSKFA